MNILGIDSSAVTASAAVVSDGKILADEFINAGLTHSETLAPLTVGALEKSGMKLFDMDVIAVTNGPGSFTGVRIGVSLAKGLAQPMEIPCMGISSLEAAAYVFINSERLIFACMDARCGQVYAAFFEGKDGKLVRLTEDMAVSLEDAAKQIRSYGRKTVVCGDGTAVAEKYFGENGVSAEVDIFYPPGDERYQRASSAALLAVYYLLETDRTPLAPKLLAPVYLRPSQAERELNNKRKLNNKEIKK